MPRLTRQQSRVRTRGRLLEIARRSFRRDGYAGTSVDRLAEEVGYTKGAVYSHFGSKEGLFLAALEAEGRATLDELYEAMEAAADTEAMVDAIATWADERAHSGNWALPILEYARHVAAGQEALQRQLDIFRACWRELGERILARCPGVEADPETLGALLHEIAHAPAMALVDAPGAGDLMRLALLPLLTGKVPGARARP